MAAPDKVVTRGRWAFRAVVSLLVLALAARIILDSQSDANLKSWATGAVGVVLGYWLR